MAPRRRPRPQTAVFEPIPVEVTIADTTALLWTRRNDGTESKQSCRMDFEDWRRVLQHEGSKRYIQAAEQRAKTLQMISSGLKTLSCSRYKTEELDESQQNELGIEIDAYETILSCLKGYGSPQSQEPIFDLDPANYDSDCPASHWTRQDSVEPIISTETVENAFKGCLRFSECLAEPCTAPTASAAIQAHSGFAEYFQKPSDSVSLGIERFNQALVEVASHLESVHESTAMSYPGHEDLGTYYDMGSEKVWGELLAKREERKIAADDKDARIKSDQAILSSVSETHHRKQMKNEVGKNVKEEDDDDDVDVDPEWWTAGDNEAELAYKRSLENCQKLNDQL